MATEKDTPNTGVIGTLVIVGGFAMLAGSMALVGLARSERSEVSAAIGGSADLVSTAAYKKSQRDMLDSEAHWADKAAGRLAISLQTATGLVVKEIAANAWAATPGYPKIEEDAGVPEEVAAEEGAEAATEEATATEAEAKPEAEVKTEVKVETVPHGDNHGHEH